MVEQLKHIKEKEFVEKVLRGEKDFSKIRLDGNETIGAPSRQRELEKYFNSLSKEEHKKEPLILDRSEIKKFEFTNLHLPYLSGRNTIFGTGVKIFNSNLENANLEGSITGNDTEIIDSTFSNACFCYGCFGDLYSVNSNFEYAEFQERTFGASWFIRSRFMGANFSYAWLLETCFEDSDLRHTDFFKCRIPLVEFLNSNLKYAKNLSYVEEGASEAVFVNPSINAKEKRDLGKVLFEEIMCRNSGK